MPIPSFRDLLVEKRVFDNLWETMDENSYVLAPAEYRHKRWASRRNTLANLIEFGTLIPGWAIVSNRFLRYTKWQQHRFKIGFGLSVFAALLTRTYFRHKFLVRLMAMEEDSPVQRELCDSFASLEGPNGSWISKFAPRLLLTEDFHNEALNSDPYAGKMNVQTGEDGAKTESSRGYEIIRPLRRDYLPKKGDEALALDNLVLSHSASVSRMDLEVAKDVLRDYYVEHGYDEEMELDDIDKGWDMAVRRSEETIRRMYDSTDDEATQ